MTPRRYAVSASALMAVGVLVFSACSSEKPSSLPAVTPNPGPSSSSPAPTSTSKWTPEQQQVIDGYDRYNELITRILSKLEPINMDKVHRVAAEPYATTYLKRVEGTVSAGYVQTGELVTTVSAVTVAGKKATIKACEDQTHTRLTNPSRPSDPKVQTLPPALATISLVREGEAWLVAGFKGDEGACVSG